MGLKNFHRIFERKILRGKERADIQPKQGINREDSDGGAKNKNQNTNQNEEKQQEVGREGQDGFNISPRRAVYKKCKHDREISGVEESFTEGPSLGNADAELLYQSSWKRAIHLKTC
jgi:hypothetical protein